MSENEDAPPSLAGKESAGGFVLYRTDKISVIYGPLIHATSEEIAQIWADGKLIYSKPVSPPESYSAERKEAWLRGYRDGQITGPDSLEVFTPYDVDDEASLYEAWQAGYDAA